LRQSKRDYVFFKNATYVIAGGLGGIEQRIASWLVDRGAQHLVLPSRRGSEGSERGRELVEELPLGSIEVRCPKCDISDMASLQGALEECNDMPLIRGAFHAAMVMEDNNSEKISIEEWGRCIGSKIHGGWNLSSLLPSGMDFFILLSSACGIFGNAGQSSYAAGNTFLDALARYCVAHGEKCTSLDLDMLL
jgi:NAD(P)-dependent dehydrogenase (short-subunit alcohol dehydrogenase family)